MNTLAFQFRFEYIACRTLLSLFFILLVGYGLIIASTIGHIAKAEEDVSRTHLLSAEVAGKERTYLEKTRALDTTSAEVFGLVPVSGKHYRPASALSLGRAHAQ